MGSALSNDADFNYDEQLFNDKVEQSREVDYDAKEGWGLARRSLMVPEGKELVDHPIVDDHHLRTVWDGFQNGVRKYPGNPMLGTRVFTKDGEGNTMRGDYVWEDYKTVDGEVAALGSGLVELGCKKGDTIGIFALNRAEWVKTMLASYRQSMRVCSLYATLGAEACEYIGLHAELEVIFTSKENLAKLKPCLPKLSHACGGFLKYVVQFDGDEFYNNSHDIVDQADVEYYAKYGVNVVGLSDLLRQGDEAGNAATPPQPDDLAYIMYTSGTTGMPKGAMLSHGNLMSTVAIVPMHMSWTDQEVVLSYLPLAHIFETIVEVVSYTNGSRVGFFQGNVKKLIEDIQTLKPTMLFGVPRVFSKIYAKVFMGVSEKRWFERIGFSIGYNKQCQLCRVGFERSEKWDRKIFIPLRTRLGLDRCKVILTGAAPCPPYLVEFLRVIVGAKVVQGYGMTETSAAISICKLDHVPIGHCGPPLACNDVRLCDVPEMNYTSADRPFPRGEICIRGPNMFKGYYKNKSATEKTIVDGWLHTGDIGRWNPSGSLSIIDRKKNIFKMSQGEYIAAEKIELAYGKCALIGQIWVYGNSFKSFIVAIVVPNAEALVKVCKEKGWWSKDVVIGSDEFRDEFHSLMTGAHAAELKKIIFTAMKDFQNDLKGFEKLRDIKIESRLDVMLSGFNEGNGCLTPTFKLKRPALLRRYIKDLKDLYAQNGEPAMAQEVWPGEQ